MRFLVQGFGINIFLAEKLQTGKLNRETNISVWERKFSRLRGVFGLAQEGSMLDLCRLTTAFLHREQGSFSVAAGRGQAFLLRLWLPWKENKLHNIDIFVLMHLEYI